MFVYFFIIPPFTFLQGAKSGFKKVIVFLGFLLPFIPFATIKIAKIIDKSFKILEENKNLRFRIFFLSALSLTFLEGLAIPSIIMESEPNNYFYVDSYKSPFVFLFSTFFQALGFFAIWPVCFYALFSVRIKKILAILFSSAAFIALTNTFVFGGHYGPIEPWLRFMQPQIFTPPVSQIILNAVVLLAIFAITVFLLLKFPKTAQSFVIILILSLSAVSLKNSVLIKKAYKNLAVPSYNNKLEPIFSLSRTNKNVLVIMQDTFQSVFTLCF